jgi:hypothetical protein
MLLDTISRYTTNSPGTDKRLLYPFGMFKLFSMNYATMSIISIITPYIRMLDSDWLIAVIFFFFFFFYKFRPCIVNLQNFYFM